MLEESPAAPVASASHGGDAVPHRPLAAATVLEESPAAPVASASHGEDVVPCRPLAATELDESTAAPVASAFHRGDAVSRRPLAATELKESAAAPVAPAAREPPATGGNPSSGDGGNIISRKRLCIPPISKCPVRSELPPLRAPGRVMPPLCSPLRAPAPCPKQALITKPAAGGNSCPKASSIAPRPPKCLPVGWQAGYNKGKQAGYDKGYDKGYEEGFSNGAAKGYHDGYLRTFEPDGFATKAAAVLHDCAVTLAGTANINADCATRASEAAAALAATHASAVGEAGRWRQPSLPSSVEAMPRAAGPTAPAPGGDCLNESRQPADEVCPQPPQPPEAVQAPHSDYAVAAAEYPEASGIQ